MKSVLISILLLFIRGDLISQTDSLHEKYPTLSQDGKILVDDAITIFTSPLHYSSEQWMMTGTIFLSTAILLNADEPSRRWIQSQHSSTNDRLAEIGTNYGREVYGFALSVGLYAGGMIAMKDDIRETGLLLFESIAFATTISTAGKYLIGRSRPFEGEGQTRFRGLQSTYSRTSFPSGHSTVAFAVSSILAERIDKPVVTLGLYSLAAITALSRIYNDQHWFSDTFAGAVIGTACGLAVAELHHRQPGRQTVTIMPTLNGIRTEIRF